jgi:hypothetical protein
MLKNHMSTCKKTHVYMQHLFLMTQGGAPTPAARPPTPYERTPYAGTGRAHTVIHPRMYAGLVPETGFSAYGSRARVTPAIRQSHKDISQCTCHGIGRLSS